ncbi:uncharacterized protein BO66DRAFT_127541 [Aspergillus aculeatinus CBS 121060]|uniref:Uncharacterized protein n=1 Tax=Aspergillus aculeatinus CBS 121060 TaxID=1448322 RepID=A0ACD1H4K0_9EURO|nr:hypothetical protein BO66DRAFT_127541 [Aspergillus aculeatinus CBS 121060]RAH68346.1 hypothetical protein BO66DRAFT_127541 [Aspergillus aculeatinus CBS 121060]
MWGCWLGSNCWRACRRDACRPCIVGSDQVNATLETFWYDLDQARRLMVLRTKIDRAISTSKLTEGAKALVRGRRDVFFGSFPPGRQWLLWKIARNMSRCDVGDTLDYIPILDLNGPEDTLWSTPF